MLNTLKRRAAAQLTAQYSRVSRRWWHPLVFFLLLTPVLALAHTVIPPIWVLYFLWIAAMGAGYGVKPSLISAAASVLGMVLVEVMVRTCFHQEHFHSVAEMSFVTGGFFVNGAIVGLLAEHTKRQSQRLATERALRSKELEERQEQQKLLETLALQSGQLRTDNEMLAHQHQELMRLHQNLQKKEQEFETLAITDELTGIYNRRHFWECLHQEIKRAKRYQRPLSFIMLDLDHFKQVNDRYGHQCGDLVLAELAALMKQALRDTDVLGRYGGEEFAIALPETGQEQAASVAERILQLVREHSFCYDSHVFTITASLGVAEMLESDEPSGNTLVKQADDAMYQAKAVGGDGVVAAQRDE